MSSYDRVLIEFILPLISLELKLFSKFKNIFLKFQKTFENKRAAGYFLNLHKNAL